MHTTEHCPSKDDVLTTLVEVAPRLISIRSAAKIVSADVEVLLLNPRTRPVVQVPDQVALRVFGPGRCGYHELMRKPNLLEVSIDQCEAVLDKGQALMERSTFGYRFGPSDFRCLPPKDSASFQALWDGWCEWGTPSTQEAWQFGLDDVFVFEHRLYADAIADLVRAADALAAMKSPDLAHALRCAAYFAAGGAWTRYPKEEDVVAFLLASGVTTPTAATRIARMIRPQSAPLGRRTGS